MTNPPGWMTPSGMIPFPGDRPVWWGPFMDLVDDLNVNRIAMVNIRPGIQSPVDYWGEHVAGRPTPTPPRPLRDWFWDYRQGAPFQWTLLDKMMENLILPLRDRLALRNEPLFVNFEYYNKSGGQFTIFRDDPDQFADWVLAIWEHLHTNYGMTPDGFSINEPSTTGDHWTMAQVGAAINAVGTRLAASGWHPRFGGPASERIAGAQDDFDDLITQPGVSQYLTDIEYHLYGGFKTSDLTALIQRGITYGKNVAMSEYLNARRNDLDALLRDGKISYFRQLGLGGLRCIPRTPAPGAATPTPAPCNPDELGSLILVDASKNYRTFIQSEAWYLRQYMKFIHMKARAIKVTTQTASLHPVAFINPNGAPVVVVNVVNMSAGGGFVLRGLPPGTYNIKYTVAGDVNHDRPAQTIASGGEIATSIPAIGVITIYRDDVLIPTRTPPPPTAVPTLSATVTRTRTGIPNTPSHTPRGTGTNTPPRTATRTRTVAPSNTVPPNTPFNTPERTRTSTLPRTATRLPTNTQTQMTTPTIVAVATPTRTPMEALIDDVVRGIFAATGLDLNGDQRVTAADVTCAALGSTCAGGTEVDRTRNDSIALRG